MSNEIQVNIFIEVDGVQKDIRVQREMDKAPNIVEDMLECVHVAMKESGLTDKDITDYFSSTAEDIEHARLDRIKDNLNDLNDIKPM